MQANDVMTQNVITVTPQSDLREIAGLLLEHRISALPVVDEDNKVLGIVSEGDLVRRVETGTERRKSWWLREFFQGGMSAGEYLKTHARKASEIMTPNPITIEENTPLGDIATLLEKNHIKRVPVVRDGRLVGIISRANLLQALAAGLGKDDVVSNIDDRQIREAILEEIGSKTNIMVNRINVVVSDGQVQLWGLVDSPKERSVVQVAAENTKGVKAVENNLGFMPHGGIGAS